MPVRECTVSFIDGCGLRHSTTVYAGSVLEAAALGLKQLRETGMLDDDAALELTVELVTRTAHQVPMKRLARQRRPGPEGSGYEGEASDDAPKRFWLALV